MPTTLNVAIGIVFVYLLFSLIVSAANEVLQSVVSKRKDYLWKGIDELLQDRVSRVSKDPMGPSKQFCNHPLIMALSKGADGLPSYIPGKLFAITIIDLIKSGTLGTDSGSKNLGDLVSKIENPALKRAMMALWMEAEGDIEAFKSNLEDWFDGAMDRVSGWYKRYVQYWLLAFGMIFAILCNVDSIHILEVLSTQPDITRSLVEKAKEYVDEHPTPPESAKDSVLTLPSDLKNLKNDVDQLDNLRLPLGWTSQQVGYFSQQWVNVILGWLLSAFAASLGAPFWFDTLNRIMNVRASGKNPDQSKDRAKAATNG
jgi:hypothetical protein